MARPRGATVHLMHNIEVPTETITGATIIREEMDEAAEESHRRMDELERLPDAADANVNRVLLKSTDPKRSILTYADENDIDLIVLGTHGRTDALEEIIGSTAERVLRRSSCPTVTVRATGTARPIEHILVPVDFSEYSPRAVGHATEVAADHNARVTIMHAADDASQSEDEERLRELGAELDGQTPDYIVAVGAVDDSILRIAEEQNADLIVMITHGHKGLRRALTSSVAESVVRKSPCPVMTYRRALEE